MGGLIALMLAANGFARAAVLMSPAPTRGIPALSVAIVTRMAPRTAATKTVLIVLIC